MSEVGTRSTPLPARCAGCFTVSDQRPLGQTPEGWTRGRSAPADADQGRYWCPECTEAAGFKRV